MLFICQELVGLVDDLVYIAFCKFKDLGILHEILSTGSLVSVTLPIELIYLGLDLTQHLRKLLLSNEQMTS